MWMHVRRGSRSARARSSAGCATSASPSIREVSRGRIWRICSAGPTRRLRARAEQLICPATGLTVAESWAAECITLTPLPEILPEPFDDVGVRRVGIDGLVALEGRQYSVPFAHVGERVEVRGCAGTVQILKDCRVIATHRRHTPARLVIDPTHYDGPSTERVLAPPPLGRMGTKMMELAPVAHRAIEFYAALAEVAR
jgi:hypothetical protein